MCERVLVDFPGKSRRVLVILCQPWSNASCLVVVSGLEMWLSSLGRALYLMIKHSVGKSNLFLTSSHFFQILSILLGFPFFSLFFIVFNFLFHASRQFTCWQMAGNDVYCGYGIYRSAPVFKKHIRLLYWPPKIGPLSEKKLIEFGLIFREGKCHEEKVQCPVKT